LFVPVWFEQVAAWAMPGAATMAVAAARAAAQAPRNSRMRLRPRLLAGWIGRALISLFLLVKQDRRALGGWRARSRQVTWRRAPEVRPSLASVSIRPNLSSIGFGKISKPNLLGDHLTET
jgi:hypothetical protein